MQYTEAGLIYWHTVILIITEAIVTRKTELQKEDSIHKQLDIVMDVIENT